MKRFINVLDNILIKLQEYICIITGVAICLLIAAAALMRYVLKMDFYGSEEYIMYAAFWLYFIGSSLAAREDGHINADMIGSFAKSVKVKKVFTVIRQVISLVISVITTMWSYQYIMRSVRLGPTTAVLKAPLILMQLPILISFVLMDFYIVYYIVKAVKNLKESPEGGAEA